MSPTGLLVDPYVFMMPSSRDDAVLLNFFVRLAQWARCLREMNCSTSERAVADLQRAGHYPTVARIREAIQASGIDSISAVDVQNSLRVFAERAPYAEERLGIEEVNGCSTLEPPIMGERLPAGAASALKDVLIASALWCRNKCESVPDIGTLDVPGAELVLSAVVELIACYGGDVLEAPTDKIEVTFCLTQDPEELLDWAGACTDPVRAIHFIYDRELLKNDCSIPPLGRIQVSPKFAESVEARGIRTQPTVLKRLYRLCALAGSRGLQDVSGAKLHPVRQSSAPDASQVTRANGDGLWRCAVTTKGAGFRLHYWKIDGGIELEEVLVESEV